MSQIFSCSFCNSTFKNSRSLYSHKYKYHPKDSSVVGEEQNNDQRSTFSGDDKSVQPHPAFWYDVNQFSQIKQSTNKRNRSDDEMSDKSEMETERYTKKQDLQVGAPKTIKIRNLKTKLVSY